MLNLLIVMAFLAGNVVKLPLFASAQISVLDIVTIICITYALLKKQIANPMPAKYAYSVLGFATIALVSLVIAGSVYGLQAQLVGLLYLIRWTSYALVGYFLPKNISILWLGFSVVVVGLLQYMLLPDVRFLAQSNWDPHYYRVVGSFLDPGYTGLLIVLFLGWLTTHRFKYQKALWVLSYAALALTYSRSSYIAFIAIMTIISFRRKSLSFLIKIVVLGILTIAILPQPGGEGVKLERTSTIYARLLNWNQALTIASNSPVLGVGFNTYRYAQRSYGFLQQDWQENHAGSGADSSLLFVLATTGTIGLAIYCLYLQRLLLIPSLSLYVVPILIHSWFLNSLFYPPVLFFLSVLIVRSMAGKSPSSLSDSRSRLGS